MRRARRANAVRLASAFALSALMVAAAYGQDLEPRAYANTPVGLNFVLGGYAYTQGSVGPDASLPVTDFKIETHTSLLAYVRSLDVWGRSGKLDLIVPYSWLSASAKVVGQGREREVSGFADPRIRFSVNFYGAPALSLEEFSGYQQDLIVGASVLVSAPLGRYDSDKAVNIGTNRWSFKPELGISQALGPLTLELLSSVTFFTENNDFFGGHRLTQDPIFAVQGHLIYRFSFGPWAALDSTYYTGGGTSINGAKSDNRQENVRVGLTVAFPLDRHFSVKISGSTGVYSRTGADFDAAGIVLQYRWGGGF